MGNALGRRELCRAGKTRQGAREGGRIAASSLPGRCGLKEIEHIL